MIYKCDICGLSESSEAKEKNIQIFRYNYGDNIYNADKTVEKHLCLNCLNKLFNKEYEHGITRD